MMALYCKLINLPPNGAQLRQIRGAKTFLTALLSVPFPTHFTSRFGSNEVTSLWDLEGKYIMDHSVLPWNSCSQIFKIRVEWYPNMSNMLVISKYKKIDFFLFLGKRKTQKPKKKLKIFF